MNSPIAKLRTAVLVVLCALSFSFTSNAVAEEGGASLAEQIATAVAAGIMESGLQGDALATAMAEIAAAAAKADPAAASAIAAAVAAQNPAAASAIAAAVAAQVPDAAADVTAAVNAAVADTHSGEDASSGGESSESTVNNTAIKANVIITALEAALNACAGDAQCRIDAATAAAGQVGSDPALAVALAAEIVSQVPDAAASVVEIIASSNTDLADDIVTAVSPN